MNEEDVKNYVQSDFNTIYEYVIDKNTPDFYDAKIVTRYKQVAEKIGIRLDDRYMVAERNPKFRIYRMLIREHLIGRTTILERKKYYLLEKLRENNSEIEKCKKLIDVVVNILPEWKLEYILEFLKVNKKLEDFKKIDLFPSFCSWSGSEIPLIIEKIDFLKLLKDNLKGIDYIDHRKYIEEYRMDLEKYKEKIELREYIENADYA